MATATIDNRFLDEEIGISLTSTSLENRVRDKERSKAILSAHVMRELAGAAPKSDATNNASVVNQANDPIPVIGPMQLALLMSAFMGKLLESLSLQSTAISQNMVNQAKASDANAAATKKNTDDFVKKINDLIEKQAEQAREQKLLSIFGWILTGLSVIIAAATGGAGSALVCLAIGLTTQLGGLDDDSPLGKALSSLPDWAKITVKVLIIVAASKGAGMAAEGVDAGVAAARGVARAATNYSFVTRMAGAQLLTSLNPTYDLCYAIAKAIPGGDDNDKKLGANIAAQLINIAATIAAFKGITPANGVDEMGATAETIASAARKAYTLMQAATAILQVVLGSTMIQTGNLQIDLGAIEKDMIVLRSNASLLQSRAHSDQEYLKSISDSYGSAMQGMANFNTVMRALVERM